uniref:Uncharacterized protein n=1 Tax=Pithovirus LCPAC403 TaxID=2506596 RepID=A0A481ZB68_9VIRU|nr:MAG: hypothetical protein LCPAC403_00200 [Pithovirus LCPAC403]
MHICKAKTKDSSACRLKVDYEGERCYYHRGQEGLIVCGAETKKGNQCCSIVKKNKQRCKIHRGMGPLYYEDDYEDEDYEDD